MHFFVENGHNLLLKKTLTHPMSGKNMLHFFCACYNLQTFNFWYIVYCIRWLCFSLINILQEPCWGLDTDELQSTKFIVYNSNCCMYWALSSFLLLSKCSSKNLFPRFIAAMYIRKKWNCGNLFLCTDASFGIVQ